MNKEFKKVHHGDHKLIEKAILNSPASESGLFSGELGKALYCIASISVTSNPSKALLKRLASSLEYSFTDLQTPKHNNPANLGNGVTGLALVLNRVRQTLGDRSVSNSLKILEDNIHELARRPFSENGLVGVDYFFGLSGIANYFAAYSAHTDRARKTKQVCDRIIDEAESIPGGIAWKDNYGFSTEPYNLGMAHGMLGTLCALSKASYTMNLKQYSSTIVKAMNWYLSQENILEAPNRFSNSTDGNALNNQRTWLSWCYGDLCVGICLLHVYKATGKERFLNEAIRIIDTTISRIDPSVEIRNDRGIVFDAGLCHGLSAAVSAYYVLSRKLKTKRLSAAFSHWLSLLVNRAPKDVRDSSARCYKVGISNGIAELTPTVGLLEGAAGVGLFYCSLISRKADRVWLPLFNLDL